MSSASASGGGVANSSPAGHAPQSSSSANNSGSDEQQPQKATPPPNNNNAASSAAAAAASHNVLPPSTPPPSSYVKLNVGGCLFHTTVGTLTKHDNMLRAMFSGRMEVLTDADGWIMIDRCGKHFGTILNFLRDGSVPLPENRRELAELQCEAKYYCMTELAEAAEKALRSMRDREEDEGVAPICRVPLITSKKEEQALIAANTEKPIVKLLINRHNNKYSYTGASDDNILKNVELFDKLSLRFSNRVLFIKDVIGSSEICCWSFYGHGAKTAEVCCTAIVYATDRKNTKVEFPEARIYEETLNCLLYENRTGPDQELMRATSARVQQQQQQQQQQHFRHHHHRRRSLDPTSDEDELVVRQDAASPTTDQDQNGANRNGANNSSSSGNGGQHHQQQQHHGGQSAARASGLSRLRSSKNHN